MSNASRNQGLATGALIVVLVACAVTAGAAIMYHIQEIDYNVQPGESAWVYVYYYPLPSFSFWSGPHIASFSVEVMLYNNYWYGLFMYEANAGEYTSSFYCLLSQ